MNQLQECNICDKQVVKLAQHVRQAHDMNMTEYYDNETNKKENSETSEMESEESCSEDEACSEDESTRESDSAETKQTFFEFLLKNIENCEELTEQEIIQQLVNSTYWFLNAKRVAKNDAMLENIQYKAQKYVDLGLKYEDALVVAFDKEAAYFKNLISRISENEEE